jgi:SAM-dependent methyltransferase
MTADAYRNLLIGCGHSRDKRIEPTQHMPGGQLAARKEWRGTLETLDFDSPCEPTYVWDLNKTPWRPNEKVLPANHYDEIHAYEVLEHLGAQGHYHSFFQLFAEIWRVLKPGGFLCGTCPSRYSQWLWGDPGHRRAILPATLTFLNQQAYTDQKGITAMTDYRRYYRADFEILWSYDNRAVHQFVLQAVKPSRRSV